MSICFSRLETSTTIAGPKNASSESSCEPDHPSRTWSGASACVPTCGLEVNKDTLTLAPAPIRDDHPQVNGVSPGHSGVSAFRVTLMCFRRGSEPLISLKSRRASGPLLLANQIFRCLHHVIDGDSEMLVNGSGRCRSAKPFHPENY